MIANLTYSSAIIPSNVQRWAFDYTVTLMRLMNHQHRLYAVTSSPIAESSCRRKANLHVAGSMDALLVQESLPCHYIISCSFSLWIWAASVCHAFMVDARLPPKRWSANPFTQQCVGVLGHCLWVWHPIDAYLRASSEYRIGFLPHPHGNGSAPVPVSAAFPECATLLGPLLWPFNWL